jgi:hypothetical protein
MEVSNMRFPGHLLRRMLRSFSSRGDNQEYFNIQEAQKAQQMREQCSAEAGEVMKRNSFLQL